MKKPSGKVDTLAAKIEHHNKKYWVDHAPEISDEAYDQLVEELRGLCPFHPVLDALTEDESDNGKVKHETPMLSLDKVFTPEEIVKWAENAKAFEGSTGLGIVASYKVDGLSCSLLYENGKLVRAATRGNGKEGDNVTANVLTIQDVPTTIPSKKKLEVRGEVYMSRASFKKNLAVFEKNLAAGKAKEDDRPSNARNFCAGSLKQKDSNVTKERGLSFMAHNVVLYESSPVTTETAIFEALSKLGFTTPFFRGTDSKDMVKVITEKIDEQRKQLPYDTDGIVWCINDLSMHKKLGYTSHHPKYRIAFKFGREQGITTVKGFNWQTSRTGRVVPTIELEPIDLGGATVTFCTGHNAKNIMDNHIMVGSKVLMEREVIPYLVKVTASPNLGIIPLPDKCLSCGHRLEFDETNTDLLCPNAAGCPAQLVSYIQHYVSKKVVNIMGVGDELIEKLVEVGLVKTPADLYDLTPEILIKKIERQGEGSANNIVDSIQSRKKQTLAVFLYSLGIPSLGQTISERLAEQFKTLDAVTAASKDDLTSMEKIGDKLASAIIEGLEDRKELITLLLDKVEIEAVVKVDGPLNGKSFCITGHVEFEYKDKAYSSRPEIESLIKSLGGTLKGVSKGLDYLLAGDEAGSKLEKAKKANVKVIDAKGFLSLI